MSCVEVRAMRARRAIWPHVADRVAGPLVLAGVTLLLALASATPARAATSKLTGHVIDVETQKPIAGADVELTNMGGGQGYFRARTDRDGAFSIDRVPSDRYYTLSVGADGYTDFTLGGWQFPAQQRAADMLVPLDRAGTLEVRLTDGAGQPLANAKVTLRSERPTEWWEGASGGVAPRYTDRTGLARFAGLAAGGWAVSAEASGLLNAEANRVAVRRGAVTPLALKLTRPASLSGAVRLADGTGVSGISVVAAGTAEAVATTGEDGLFTIGDL